jgi:ubiquinone/menaquinone biosynthesis C-methylase UbiE
MRGIEQIPWLYDSGMALLEATGLRAWRAWLAKGATGRVLDLGCGTGRNLELLGTGVRAVGVDPCPVTIRKARARAPGVMLVQARAEALPFREGAFDTVLCGLVFCSVEDPPAGLREVQRVLKRGGTLRMLEHVRAAGSWHAWLQDRAQPAWTWITGGCHPNRDTEAEIARAGFVVDAGSRRASGIMRRLVATATIGDSPSTHSGQATTQLSR